jgi:hypothetical protein
MMTFKKSVDLHPSFQRINRISKEVLKRRIYQRNTFFLQDILLGGRSSLTSAMVKLVRREGGTERKKERRLGELIVGWAHVLAFLS